MFYVCSNNVEEITRTQLRPDSPPSPFIKHLTVISPLSSHSNASLMEGLKKNLGLLLFIGAMPSNTATGTSKTIMETLLESRNCTATDGRAVLINDFKSRVYSMSSHWVPGFDTVNQ